MKTQLNQLERMYDRLSPKERAILALQRWKADQPPDEALKRSTPQHDVRMVWKYLDAARETETIVGGQASWLEAKLEAIQARLGILAAIRLFELFSDRLRFDVHFDFPELLTESQHRERCEHLPVDAGRDVPVLASRAARVVILPDGLGEYVAAAETARLRLVDCLDDETGEQHQRMARIQEALALTVARELGQAEMMRLGLEEVVGWAAGDFDDEEPIHPDLRADLDATAGWIRELADQLRVHGAEVELPTAGDAETFEVLKRAIAN